MRIHHCYADGVALMRVLLALTTDAKPERRSRGGLVQASLQWTGALWQGYVELLLNPSKALQYLQTGAGATLEAIKLLSLPPEPQTRFRGELGVSKRVAWCQPLKLAAVKKVGKTFGCTINDVLLAAAAGALGAYLGARHELPKELEIHVAVPVNLRAPHGAEALGNEFGLVFLGLPLGIADPVARLHAVHERMEALRRSPQPLLILGLLGFAGQAPMAVQEQLLQIFSSHATAVMTNVPGPQRRLRFAGAEIDEQMFWVPQSGAISMGASILSYAGQVQFGLMTDAGRVPDPERIVAHFPVEIARLQEAVA
jgi:WS/DGAT/MGAT family acyltransferase